ncbi:hypothetical protein BX600DRAFT_444235 [Xylariales sp. PMI_506]|nr:hypothetical protein BX600DRAFT_444235 [Xylariales sp. PMI_506]
MTRLPPVEKLSIAVRKNGLVRDEYDSKKENFAKDLSTVLSETWTIDVNPNLVFAYATDGYAKESLGSCLASYIDSAIYQIKYFASSLGEDAVKELNTIAYKHVITMDVDDEKRFSYCGVDVHEGALRILFAPDKLGTNINDACEKSVLLKALNDAPPPEGSGVTLSFHARNGIRQDYEPKIESIQKKVGELVGKADIKLNPNWEHVFAKLKEESQTKKTDLRSDWESDLGRQMHSYFDGFLDQLKWQKFEDDELLQEGFQEAVDKGEVVFRIVDKLADDSYAECQIEDGVLYLQCIPKTWGVNVTYAAQKLTDKL